MYPTIYLIILLSAQETPKVLANQLSVRACWGRPTGTRPTGRNPFTESPFVGSCWQQ